MSMWYGIKGSIKRLTGASGTLTFNSGARILKIKAASGTITMPDGTGAATIVVPAALTPFNLDEYHAAFVMQGTGAQLQLVFSGPYFVEYIDAAGAS